MSQSQLIFDPATGISAPDTSVIREAVESDWKAAFYDPDLPELDTEPTTPAGQLIDAEVAEIEAAQAATLYTISQFNPATASGRFQDALGYIYFLARKLAEPTVVTCQLTGLNGTAIPYGAIVQAQSGEQLICQRSVTIDSTSTAETPFRVVNDGPIDIPAHTVTQIITTIPGWDTVDNVAAGALGRDIETRYEFESRRAASVAMNAHGSVAAIYGTIANINGVLDVEVLENIGPDPVIKYGVTVPGHGITVCVYGGEDGDIAEAIYRKKDNGADTGGNTEVTYTAVDYANAIYMFLILRPTPINFWIRVTLGAGAVISDTQIAALKQALYNDFQGLDTNSGNPRVGLASTVYASRFYCAASHVDGVNDIQEIAIALSDDEPTDYTNRLDIRGDQEPTISLDNISVVVAS